jgi:hypothetical protein
VLCEGGMMTFHRKKFAVCACPALFTRIEKANRVASALVFC